MNELAPDQISSLVCFWDCQEAAGNDRVARRGPHPYRLAEQNGAVERVAAAGAPWGPWAARLGTGARLAVPRADCPALNFCGSNAQVTIVAWIKRFPAPPGKETACQAVAGMWNEHALRQYCLFLNLRIHDSAEQVGAHVSGIGGATPGHKYCLDAAVGATAVPFDTWRCIAMTYDGTFARAFLDGHLDARGDRNPYRYPGGLFDGGPRGADFTVGAVPRPERVDEERRPHGSVVANTFHGLLGGLAVYDRALSQNELRALAGAPR